MRTKFNTLLSNTTFALCGMLLSVPYAMANERNALNRADEKFI